VVVSSSLDSSIRLWDINTGERVSTIESGPVDVWTVAFSPDARHIISGSHSGKISLFGVESGKLEQTLDTRGKFTLSIAYVRTLVKMYNNLTNMILSISFSESRW
jgi:WD repeat-containing protein 61